MPVIGFIAEVPLVEPLLAAFRRAMAELGYVEGKTFAVPAQVFATPSAARILSHPFSLFYRMWPVAAGVALIFNVVWIGFHGFELFKLIF